MGAALGLGGRAGGAERLNAELKFDEGDDGEFLLGGNTGGGAVEVNPAKSFSAK